MLLTNRSEYGNRKEYYCELTEELDKICGCPSERYYRNYMLDTRDIWDDCIAIRVPGRTTGSVYVDADNIITSCVIAEDCCGEGKRYPADINDILKKYIGTKLEINA